MEQTSHSVPSKVKRGRQEGLKPHLIGYVASLLLTFIAFMAAGNHLLSTSFVILLISIVAIVQALIQLSIWMHLKDPGHFYQKIFLGGGALITLTVFASAFFFSWWVR